MTIILEPFTLPKKGKVNLKVDRSFDIKVTAEEARRKVQRWLVDEVSLLLGADEPTLVVGDRVVWRVPAWLGLPHTGRIGVVGTVEVDVTTGEMTNSPACKADLERRSEELAAHQPPFQPKKAPKTYLAQGVPPVPVLHIQEDGTLLPATSPQE